MARDEKGAMKWLSICLDYTLKEAEQEGTTVEFVRECLREILKQLSAKEREELKNGDN